MSQLWESLMAPLGITLHRRAIISSNKAIKQYYDNLDRSKLSKDLLAALGKTLDVDKAEEETLRDTFKSNAVNDISAALYWEEDNFKTWVATHQLPSFVTSFMPKLWHVFLYFAHYPFPEGSRQDNTGLYSKQQRIEEDAFVQAYCLLALRGVELLGNTQNGWTPTGDIEKSWSQKLPRLAWLMFDCLSMPSTKVHETPQKTIDASHKRFAEGQLMDAIVLAQPLLRSPDLSLEEELREAARNLRLGNNVSDQDMTASSTIARHDLQTLIQFFLLLRLEDSPWRRGITYRSFQLCGDAEKPTFVSNKDGVLLATQLADAFIQHTLGNIDTITWESFETISMAYPKMVLRFYQFWTAICVRPTYSFSSQNISSKLPNPLAQVIALVRPVEFDRSLDSGGSEAERELQVDLQTATLVADSTSKSALDGSALVERLADESSYHILILSTEDALVTASKESTGSREGVLALFTSPNQNKISLSTPGWSTYIWRYGLVQLLPFILTLETGGLLPSLQDDIISFSPHHPRSQETSTLVKMDLNNNTVMIEQPGSALQRLTFRSLKCYRLPRAAISSRMQHSILHKEGLVH